MICSMTGFANKIITLTSSTGDKTHVSISLKSLNYRFFETTFKLPHPLSYLETRLIELCKKRLARGHIYLTVYISNPNLFRGTIEPTFNTITNYLDAINTIKSRFNISQEVSLDHILRLPDIFAVEETTTDTAIETRILDTINELLDAVVQARVSEGAHLEQDLRKRLDVMQTEIEAIDAGTQSLVTAQKDKISRISQTLDADPTSIAKMQQEALYAMLDKIDIHEEIVRFKSHLEDIVTKQLSASEPEKGKRLDFTLQELGREINTISAKCSDAAIGKRAINVKVEIEKAREQVQNIV
jgi:uncharacterized protein (TIGR00255 family)